MGAAISTAMRKVLSKFMRKKISVCLVGLENSGKSTLLSVLLSGHSTPTVPTIGLNVKVVRKSRIEMKVWDIGGAAEYRQEWGRYASGSDVCVFVVDASDPGKLGKVREEMGKLLEDEVVRVMPMLILANKVDIVPHVNEKELVERLGLEEVEETPWIIMPTSALNCTGIDSVIEWLISVAHD